MKITHVDTRTTHDTDASPDASLSLSVYRCMEADPAKRWRGAELISATGLTRAQVHSALGTLACKGMVERDRRRGSRITGKEAPPRQASTNQRILQYLEEKGGWAARPRLVEVTGATRAAVQVAISRLMRGGRLQCKHQGGHVALAACSLPAPPYRSPQRPGRPRAGAAKGTPYKDRKACPGLTKKIAAFLASRPDRWWTGAGIMRALGASKSAVNMALRLDPEVLGAARRTFRSKGTRVWRWAGAVPSLPSGDPALWYRPQIQGAGIMPRTSYPVTWAPCPDDDAPEAAAYLAGHVVRSRLAPLRKGAPHRPGWACEVHAVTGEYMVAPTERRLVVDWVETEEEARAIVIKTFVGLWLEEGHAIDQVPMSLVDEEDE